MKPLEIFSIALNYLSSIWEFREPKQEHTDWSKKMPE